MSIQVIVKDREKEQDERRMLALLEALGNRLTKAQIVVLLAQPEEVQIEAIIAAMHGQYVREAPSNFSD